MLTRQFPWLTISVIETLSRRSKPSDIILASPLSPALRHRHKQISFLAFYSTPQVPAQPNNPIPHEESLKQSPLKPGLYLVGTPIGNLEDITLWALRVLREANVILSEDTRHSRMLMQHYNIKTPFARNTRDYVETDMHTMRHNLHARQFERETIPSLRCHH